MRSTGTGKSFGSLYFTYVISGIIFSIINLSNLFFLIKELKKTQARNVRFSNEKSTGPLFQQKVIVSAFSTKPAKCKILTSILSFLRARPTTVNRESDSSRCSRYNSHFSCPAIHYAVLLIFRDLHTIVTRDAFTGLK